MVLRRALGRGRYALAWASLAAIGVLAGVTAMMAGSSPANAAPRDPADAASDSCAYPLPGSVSVHSTLRIVVNGVDEPSMTTVTEVDVPESWPGTGGLFDVGEQQGRSLACFMPIDEFNYQVDPPGITVKTATSTRPALVHITNTTTVTDGPESGWPCPDQAVWQCWRAGLWTIQKTGAGYAVAFAPAAGTPTPGYQSWTVTLEAQDMNVTTPLPRPATDDGHGTLTWSFPPAQRKPPSVTASLGGPWQVRMNLASDRWWPRWLSDSSWTVDDGGVFDVVMLLFSWRLRRRWQGNRERQRLPNAMILVALFSIACYAWYVTDDYVWHNSMISGNQRSGDAVWMVENTVLAIVSGVYFLVVLEGDQRLVARSKKFWLVALPCIIIGAAILFTILASVPSLPVYYYGSGAGFQGSFGLARLLLEMIPLLLAMTLTGAGTVLLIDRLWPFGKTGQPGLLRTRDGILFKGKKRVMALLAGMLAVSILALGQSAASSYYYWMHSDWWRQGAGAFAWVVNDLMNDSHWWIGDGIQWSLYFALFAGAFALLRSMSGDARGVFFRHCDDGGPSGAPRGGAAELGDRVLMAALAGSLFVGTWGYYDGFAIPVPFIVTFASLCVWGFTSRLSVLDCGSSIVALVNSSALRLALASGAKDLRSAAHSTGTSLLAEYRNDLLAISEVVSADIAGKPAAANQDPAGSPNRIKPGSLSKEIPLASSIPDNGPHGAQAKPHFGLKVAEPVDPGVIALALGPANTWWDNGIEAVKQGAYLAIGPIGFDVFIAWNSGDLSLLGFPFGLQDVAATVAGIAISWLAGLFLFGALVPYLRGVRTPLKGVTFGLIAFAAFAADAGVRHALGVAPYATYAVDGLLAVALFGATGLLLDLRTLRRYNDQELLGGIYRLGGVRVAVTLVTTLIVVGVSLWQAVYLTDQTTQQRVQNFSSAAQYTNQNLGKP